MIYDPASVWLQKQQQQRKGTEYVLLPKGSLACCSQLYLSKPGPCSWPSSFSPVAGYHWTELYGTVSQAACLVFLSLARSLKYLHVCGYMPCVFRVWRVCHRQALAPRTLAPHALAPHA